MTRLLPMIFACLSLVGYAVFHAHVVQADDYAQAVPTAAAVSVEALAN